MGKTQVAGVVSLSATCLKGKGSAASLGLGCSCQATLTAGGSANSHRLLAAGF